MPCLSSLFRYLCTCLTCIALLCLAAPSLAAPRKHSPTQEEQKELHMWHDTEGIVHIKDQKPEEEEVREQQFADDLLQPNPDANATAPAETAAPMQAEPTQAEEPAPAEGTALAPSNASPAASENGTAMQPVTEPAPQAATLPAQQQPGNQTTPESRQSVVQPMQPRPGQMQPGQNIPPELQRQMDEARKDMPPEVQQQMDQAMREMQQNFGQQQPEMSPGVMIGMMLGMLGAALIPIVIFGLLSYVLFCFVLSRIGKKFFIGTFLQWLIPFYNLILLTRCAGLSPWFAAPTIVQFALSLLMIPLVFSNPLFAMSMASLLQIIGIIGYIAMAIVFGNIAKRLGKNLVLWVILMLIPLVQLVCGLILAFDSSRPILDGDEIPAGPSDDTPPRRRGKAGSQPDEMPLLSAPPKPPRKKDPLDD